MKSIVAVVLVAVLMSGCFVVQKSDPPKDEALLRAYSDHRAAFAELADFCQRHPRVSRIAQGFTVPSDLSEIGISIEDLARVRYLLREAGCEVGLVRAYGSGGSMFAFFAEGLPSGGVSKGLAIMDSPPQRTESSLDSHGWHTTAHVRAFRLIEGRWYIYFQRD